MEPAAAAAQQRASRSGRLRSGHVLVLMVAAGLVLLLWKFSVREIVGFLYHPVGALVIVVMAVEFLWLKSSDRTRIFHLEIERMRAAKRRDEELLGRARNGLQTLLDAPPTEEQGRPGDLRQKTLDLIKDLDHRL